MAEMWLCLVVLERESLPKLEVKVLVSATEAVKEKETAIKIALDTPVPVDIPINLPPETWKGKTPRELGYHVVCCYKVEAAYPPLVVAWYH